MIIYKVFYKNYEFKRGQLVGTLTERRKNLRGNNPFSMKGSPLKAEKSRCLS